jgi:precorrin-3B methylase
MGGPGSLVCVGIGMTLGSHLTPLARSYIEKSDVVFAGLSDGIIELWLAKMHPDVRTLQSLYQEGKSRLDTYGQMLDCMLTEVRAGKQVCGAFYGHAGVFAWPPHKAIEIARAEGYRAHMEPGVSAEDCLYADLGIDPGKYGCQHQVGGRIDSAPVEHELAGHHQNVSGNGSDQPGPLRSGRPAVERSL